MVTRQANRRNLDADAETSTWAQMNRWASPDHGKFQPAEIEKLWVRAGHGQFLPAEGTGLVWRTRGGRVARLLRVYHSAEVHL